MKKVLLSEESFEKIMLESSMIASSAYAKQNKPGFGTELLLVSYSAWLAEAVHDRLFKEVEK